MIANLILEELNKFEVHAINTFGKTLSAQCSFKVDSISCVCLLDAAFGCRAFSNSVHCNHSSNISASRSSE